MTTKPVAGTDLRRGAVYWYQASPELPGGFVRCTSGQAGNSNHWYFEFMDEAGPGAEVCGYYSSTPGNEPNRRWIGPVYPVTTVTRPVPGGAVGELTHLVTYIAPKLED